MISFLLAGLLASSVAATDVVFASGANCTGQALFGDKNLTSTTCYDLSINGLSRSAVISNIEPGTTVHFFSDNACQNALSTIDADTCYDGHVGSFRVEPIDAATTDITPHAIKLTNYRELGDFDPYHVDYILSRLFIAGAITVVATGLNLYAAVYACVAADQTGKAPDIFACLATPLATMGAYAAHYLVTTAKKKVNTGINLATGTITNLPGRSVPVDFSDINAQYMAAVASLDSGEHSRLTPVDHQMGREIRGLNHTSPLYELDMGAAGKWHFAAFYDDESDTFIHHAHAADETELAKRSAPYGYDGILWGRNGLDMAFCPLNLQASTDGFAGVTLDSTYNTIYDQLTCLFTSSQLKSATRVDLDFHNEESAIKGTVAIVPYKGSSGTVPSCNLNTVFPTNEDCIIA